MNRSTAVVVLTLLAMVLVVCLSVRADGRKITFVGAAPPNAWLDAAKAEGLELLPPSASSMGTADVCVISRDLADDGLAKQVVNALDRGATVIWAVGAINSDAHEVLRPRLPINTWSIRTNRLLRGDTSLVAAAGTALAGTGDLAVSTRYDLHLPLAPIESPMQRYQWKEYHKGLLNTEWRVHLTCGTDAGLPALVSGRSGPGRVFVFAGTWDDPVLQASAGYAAMARALLAEAKLRSPIPRDPLPAAQDVDLEVPPHQPQSLRLGVHNRSDRPATVMVVWKVSNWGRELRRMGTQIVSIPARQSLWVDAEQVLAEVGAASVRTSADEIPLLNVHAGIALPDRSKVLAETRAVVSTAGALTMECEEDGRTYGDMLDWPVGEAKLDGVLGYRYVYRSGNRPVVRLRIRNGLLNLAPLAEAQDLKDSANWTAQGLNDLSFSDSSLRGDLPLQGGWSGKPAEEQVLALRWPVPVTLAGHRMTGYGSYRTWERANPRQYRIEAAGATGEPKILEQQKAARFAGSHGDRTAYHESTFASPRATTACTLRISGLDPKANFEPRHWKRPKAVGEDTPSNCSLMEWEVYGWPAPQAPPRITGTLQVLAHDLSSGESSTVLEEAIDLQGCTEQVRRIELPSSARFGPMRYEFLVRDGTKVLYRRQHDALFVADGGKRLLNKDRSHDLEMGLLCAAGWVQIDDFGKGTKDRTQGWAGEDNRLWAYTHNLLEINARQVDKANSLFTSPSQPSHYTNPWRVTPNGEYSWDWVSRTLLANLTATGRKGNPVKRLHVIGSDRWNGIPINATWGWGEFIDFDQHLRQRTGKGLTGRTRQQLSAEISQHHGDTWQKWHLQRYAERLEETQRLFKAAGIEFTFETHGSFPLAGGELGAQLARTHTGVGTDLFWELHRQDLFWSLGRRFGVVALNPDLRSGAYAQWGWINTEVNRWWFANNGSVEPARRQWYATYFAGRVGSDGQFQPYHVYGFSAQGNVGVKFFPEDHRQFARTLNMMTQLRPEQASGMGIIVSPAVQERHMGAQLERSGFGLFTSDGADVDQAMGHVFHKLVKHGLPISFVSSTHALRNWTGNNPLVLVDGTEYSRDELDTVRRLNQQGAMLIATGDPTRLLPEAQELFGVRLVEGRVQPSGQASLVQLAGGSSAVLHRRPGHAPTILIPTRGEDLPMRAAAELVGMIQRELGAPLTVPLGVAATPFIAQNHLLLALMDQGDVHRVADVSIRPDFFKPGLDLRRLRVIDLDRNLHLPSQLERDGTLRFNLDVPASSGRMLLFAEGKP